ncbi:copine-8 [Anaeramoeba flamelloides]|uniref:Copine-8 n=1 Tax=Anaeramoeba flamelloides TaxID=1746091 RepID=A0AAV7Z0Q2_9EUKA|nr:copine-8 [Anaeramoeba flamelloides]
MKGIKKPQIKLKVEFINCPNKCNILLQKINDNKEKEEWDEIQNERISTNKQDFSVTFAFDSNFPDRSYFKLSVQTKGSESAEFGFYSFTLGDLIICIKEKKNKLALKDPKTTKDLGSFIQISLEEEKKESYLLKMAFSSEKIKKLSSKSNVYLKFLFIDEENEISKEVWRTMRCPSKEIQWNSFKISSNDFCMGEFDHPITVECWEQKSSEKEKLAGVGEITLEEMIQSTNDYKFPLVVPGTQKKKKAKQLGIIDLVSFSKSQEYSLFSYLTTKLEIQLAFAVDFTASNGLPKFPNSLHYRDPPKLNQYETVIHTLGSALLPYQKNKNTIPALGFGGKINTTGKNINCQCFPLNGKPENPECEGIGGVLNAYQNALKHVGLHGPANFANIIKGMKVMTETLGNTYYTVLIIITDGDPCDLVLTVNALLSSSKELMSVVFVGVGDDNFTDMKRIMASQLDQKYRKNFHFVKFDENFKNNPKLFIQSALNPLNHQILEGLNLKKIKSDVN